MTDVNSQVWSIPLWAGEAQNVDRIIRQSDRILCATSPAQWSYAIIFKVPIALRSCSLDLVIEFDMDVVSGQIGLGALQNDGTNFVLGVDEVLCEPGISIFPSLKIPQTEVLNFAMLVVRNTAPKNVVSEFIIKSISVRPTE